MLAGRFEGLEALLVRADWVWERMLRDPAFETRWALYHDIGMEFPSLASIRRPRPFSGSRPLYMCTRLACGHGPGMALNLGPMWTRIGSLCSYPCLY